MVLTTYGEKTTSEELDQGVTRHRNPLACTIGTLARLVAYDIDCHRAPVMDEIARGNSYTQTRKTVNPQGIRLEKFPLWSLRCVIHGKTSGAYRPMTDSTFDKDWREFTKGIIPHVANSMYHRLRHTGLDNLVQMEVSPEAQKRCGNWGLARDKTNTMTEVYRQRMHLWSDIFPEAGWQQPYTKTHVMERSEFTAEWFLQEPWRSELSWAPHQHLLPWQPEWAAHSGMWDTVEKLLMPGDQQLKQQYSGAAKDPVNDLLPFFRWWKEIILQDAPILLAAQPEASFFKEHPLFKDLGFRSFFDQLFSPLVMAAHLRSETECERQIAYDDRAELDKLVGQQDQMLAKHMRAYQDMLDRVESMHMSRSPSPSPATPEPIAQNPRQASPCLPAETGYPRRNKQLLQWQAAGGGQGPVAYVEELHRKWEFFNQQIRPYTDPNCALDKQLAGWANTAAEKRYNEQRYLFKEVVARGAGSAERETAVVAVMAEMLTKVCCMLYLDVRRWLWLYKLLCCAGDVCFAVEGFQCCALTED